MTAFMHQQSSLIDTDVQKVVADLQARVAMLESAMALFIGLPPLANHPTEHNDTPLPDIDAGARAPGHTQVLKHLGSIGSTTDNGPVSTRPHVEAASPLTEFAGLDAVLAEAAAAECAVQSARSGTPTFHEIDPSVVEQRMAKPPPEVLHVSSALEVQYPKILAKISAMWPGPDLVAYLNQLIVDDRGSRNGFDPEVMSELLIISQMLTDPRLARAGMRGIRPV